MRGSRLLFVANKPPLQVWISFAKYEYSVGNVDAARKIFLQAYSELKREGLREEVVCMKCQKIGI